MYISGYDLSETAKYCARYPQCFEITEFCNMWVAVRSSRGSGTNIFRKQTYTYIVTCTVSLVYTYEGST